MPRGPGTQKRHHPPFPVLAPCHELFSLLGNRGGCLVGHQSGSSGQTPALKQRKGAAPSPTSGSRPEQTQRMTPFWLPPQVPRLNSPAAPSVGWCSAQRTQAVGPLGPAIVLSACPLPITPTWLLLSNVAYRAAHFPQTSSP